MKFKELLDEVAKKKPDKKKKSEKKPAKKIKKAVKDKFDPAEEPGNWQGKDKSAKTEYESSLK